MKSLEIFSCSGGFAKGFQRAGVVFTWMVDRDPDACSSYERNHGHRPLQMDARDLLRMIKGGWSPGALDLLVADPPCTPWSRAGKRLGEADERDMLGVTVDIIALLRPRAYLIGNVPGLDDSTQWHVVQKRLAKLAKVGYCVRDYASLDAADYGVPQHRVRPFWFGHLEGPCLKWPAPTHCDPKHLLTGTLPGIAPLSPWVTCRDALGHLTPDQLGRHVTLKRRDPKHPPCSPDAPSTTVRSGGDNGNSAPHVLLDNPFQPARDPDRPMKTITASGRGHTARLRTSQGMRVGSVDEPGNRTRTYDPVINSHTVLPSVTLCRDKRLGQ